MAKVESVHASSERLLNRELSWLDFNARVLELAEDPSVPLLERVKFCSIFSSNLDEFFMVRVGGLMRQAGSNVPMRSVDGRTPPRCLAQHSRASVDVDGAPGRACGPGSCSRRSQQRGFWSARASDCTNARARRARRAVRSRAVPGPYTARSRVPDSRSPTSPGSRCHSGCSFATPIPGRSGSPASRCRKRFRGSFASARRGLLLPVEEVIGHFLPWLFPGMEIGERAVFRVRVTPTSKSPTRRTTCSRRSSSRFADAASARSSGSRSHSRCRRRCSISSRRAWTSRRIRCTRSAGCSISPT